MNKQTFFREPEIRQFVNNYRSHVDTNWVDLEGIIDYVKRTTPDKMTPNDFYNYVADYCVSKTSVHPDYNKLASRICVDRLHKSTPSSILDVVDILYNNVDVNGNQHPLVSKHLVNNVNRFKRKILEQIDMKRDYLFDYFGIRTLERSYLMKIHDKDKKKVIIERPQHMIMRVALGIHGANIEAALQTYNLISQRYFTHATPTLFNAGTNRPQLSSCFLENTEILTLNEGVKKIQDVKIGDIVPTHTGNARKVTQLHKNSLGDRKILRLKVNKTKEIFVTEDHKFWSSTDKKTAKWIRIDELDEKSFIAIPNYEGSTKDYVIDVFDYLNDFHKNNKISYEYEHNDKEIWLNTKFTHSNLRNVDEVTVNRKSSKINRFWKITPNFANLIGMFLGDGNIVSKKDPSGSRRNLGIQFTIFDKNTPEIEFIKKTGKELFGISSVTRHVKNQNVVQVTFNSVIIAETFFRLFGKGFNGKHIPPFMFDLSKNVIFGLLSGLITTDGCISRAGVVSLQMSNKILMNQLYHLFRSRGLDVSLSAVAIPKNKIVLENTFKYYKEDRLEICYKKMESNIKNQSSPIIIENQKFLKIESIEETKLKPVYVYTIGVEKDHSYNVEGLVCENCFLFGIDDDLDNIFGQVKQMGMISKWAGGIGVHLSGIRPRGSIIRGTNGISEGIIPLCSVLNKVSRYVNQGGKRPGSIACYLEPYHVDIFDFCELRKANTGNDDTRARDLFLALWIPDLFMKRVKNDEMWSLMCPDECPGLNITHGTEFEKLYVSYEEKKMYRKQVTARSLWRHILECQMETGFPYMLYKDNVNNKSNQKNLGTIRSSNLCAEIVQYSDGDATAVCNLASICLPRYIKNDDGAISFDYEKLMEVTRVIVRNLNKIIDINYYPIESTRKSNKSHRPMGIGVQGLADCYNLFSIPYESAQATELNKKIFETIYYAALSESNILAKKYGHYSTFKKSPFSQGKLQFHLWGMSVGDLLTKNDYDWNVLISDIKKYGTRNSLLTALMPTAGTSQIMKCYESFEPYMSNVFVRTTIAGEFIVINENLVKDLIKENLWSDDMRKLIIINKGSVQQIDTIPQKLKDIYKTAFELKLKSILSQSADRGPFIDQSQSMNLFMNKLDPDILTSAHFYGWERGLKTGMYYLRTTPAVEPIQFGIDISDIIRLTGKSGAMDLIMDSYKLSNSVSNEIPVKSNDDSEVAMCKYVPGKSAEGCLMCSS